MNKPVFDSAGKLITDFDIELRVAVIQVKSKGKELASQLERTASATQKPVVGFGPKLKPHVVREVQRRGGLVAISEDLLLDVIKP